MLKAWQRSEDVTLAPGTLNLCCDRALDLPEDSVSLQPFAHLAPAWAQSRQGFSPRLYPVFLNNEHPAWLYRWSAEPDLRNFVADADGCVAERRCEVVAEVHLTTALALERGDEVVLRFA